MKLDQGRIGAALSLSALFFRYYLCNEYTADQRTAAAALWQSYLDKYWSIFTSD